MASHANHVMSAHQAGLAGLPPAYIGVGTAEVLAPTAPLSERIWAPRYQALRRALG